MAARMLLIGMIFCLAWGPGTIIAHRPAKGQPAGANGVTERTERQIPQPNDKRSAPAAERDAADDTPIVEQIVRRMADHYHEIDAYSVEVTSSLRFEARGMNMSMDTHYEIKVQRPNRVSMVVTKGTMGSTLVSDGQQLTTYWPALGQYTVEDAPETLDEISPGGGLGKFNLSAGQAGVFLAALMSSDIGATMLEGVNETTYLGVEELDGVECHHCRFEQDEMDWEMWVNTGDQPLIRKFAVDLGKQVAELGDQAPMVKDAKIEAEHAFHAWNVGVAFAEDSFAYSPPSEAKQVDSFFGDLGGDEEPHALLGKKAPIFATAMPDDTPVNIDQHLGESVVILDFWATWCGPCREALPTVAKVANKYKDRSVIFYAVNLSEEVEIVREFLESEGWEVPVAMDPEGTVGEQYGVEAIPQTVLIGKDGTVQVVHVGASPNLEEKLSAQIEDLLAGKDLAQEALTQAARDEGPRPGEEPNGMELVWSVDGRWQSVAADPRTNTVLAVGSGGIVTRFSHEGESTDETALREAAGTALRVGNLLGDEQVELLSFDPWGQAVHAHDAEGNHLWAYPGGQGVDDVWAADLNGDGLDEVIVGYNGSTGLHTVDNQGSLLWKHQGIGNVWHVCAGDMNADDQVEVVTTSARGQLHFFDTDGNKIKDLSLSFYGHMVRLAKSSLPELPLVAIVGGSGDDGELLSAVSYAGDALWSVPLKDSSPGHIDSCRVADMNPWVAVAMRGGDIHVVDTFSGESVANVGDQGQRPVICWLERDGQPTLLIVAAGRQLNAFRMLAADPPTVGTDD